MSTETQDIRMPMKKVRTEDGRELQSSERFELGRNFCNKIWNAARFAFMNLTDATSGGPAVTDTSPLDITSLPIEDRWILSRLSAAAVEVNDALASFQFSRAATAARDFFWDSLCDWYLELVKLRVREDRQANEARRVLAFTLDHALRLLHPFIPHITEGLWQQLNTVMPQRSLGENLVATPDPVFAGQEGVGIEATRPALLVAPYPPAEGWSELSDPQVDEVFEDLQTATRAVREIRQSQNVPPKTPVNVTIQVPPERVDSMKREAHVIRELANVGTLLVDTSVTKSRNDATLVVGDMQIFVHDVIDPAAERARLEKELANVAKQISGLSNKLANAGFVANAPAEVVAAERARLEELNARHETVRAALASLE